MTWTIELPSGWQTSSGAAAAKSGWTRRALYVESRTGPKNGAATRKFAVDFMMLEAKYYPPLRNVSRW